MNNSNYHASIWIKKGDNNYIGIYLHLFPQMFHCGYMLLTEYTQKNKVDSLINLGDIYELREYSNAKGTDARFNSIAYHRDQGETLRQYKTNSESATHRHEYNYLFKDNKWHIGFKEGYQELSFDLIEDEIASPIIFHKY